MPFTIEQFLSVFRSYNESVWPAQILLTLLGAAAAAAAWSGRERGARFAAAVLGALLIWCGVMYHWMHFTRINGAAWVFGAAFVAGGVALLWSRRTLRFTGTSPLRMAIGAALAAYALLLYPAAGYLLGHRYPYAPTFGAPCPLTILVLGIVVTANRPLPIVPALVPLLWAAVGTTAAFKLGIPEDLGLGAAGAVVLFFAVTDRLPRREPSAV